MVAFDQSASVVKAVPALSVTNDELVLNIFTFTASYSIICAGERSVFC